MRLPLRWIGILHGRIHADLAATGGIHTSADCLKMMMVGSKVAMLCSVLLKKGIDQIAEIEKGMREWMAEHEYESIEQMQGSVKKTATAFERAHYMRALAEYKL
jgi:dihydroorotate dehydrogenase (fumarate)